MNSVNINFNNIRPLNGKQDEAFEELICQLARNEQIPNAKQFIRKGKPDAGVECIWILKNGAEYGWQAKYFTKALNEVQWKEIDKSVETAINKHPKLKKYYIAMPIDPSDARLPRQKSMLDKWNQRVTKWKLLAQTKGLTVAFERWGHSEIVTRLSEKTNEGKTYFWFNQLEFTDNWFLENCNNCIRVLLNKRYTPQLNVELPIAKLFSGLSRDLDVKTEIDTLFEEIIDKFKAIQRLANEVKHNKHIKKIIRLANTFKDSYLKLEISGIHNIDFDGLIKVTVEILNSCDQLENEFFSTQHQAIKDDPKKYEYTNPPLSSEISDLRKFKSALRQYNQFLESPTCQLINLPYLLIQGKAGMGKSHLLADIVTGRIRKNYYSVFLLGQHFTNENHPWTQILGNQLRLSVNENVFLGALNSKAEASGRRIIIFIDALNEGTGRIVWPEHLQNFLMNIKKYVWLGVVLSLRTSYERLIAPPETLETNDIIRVTHEGFLDNEYEATKRFFNEYGLQQPTMPLLLQEFQNPLFLKLLCDGLSNMGYTRMPKGFIGITQVLTLFLNSINNKLSKPSYFNYSENINVVEEVVRAIITWKVDTNSRYIPYKDAYRITHDTFLKYCTKGGNYLEVLISEGLFSEDVFWDKSDNYEKGIYLSYERFEDNLRVAALIDKYVDLNNPEQAFKSGYLFDITKDQNRCYLNNGVIEALSIQIPEKTGKELYEVADHARKFVPVVEAWIESIIWRDEANISEKVLDYINEIVLKRSETKGKFWDTLISIAIRPGHYLNAMLIHRNLIRVSLPERDAWWAIYLNDKYDINSSVKRLIDWSWSFENKAHIEDEVIRLSCITLAWFLSSPNRYLRDASTKAMINLLQNRFHLAKSILVEFEGVDDPFIYERLFCVIYGSLLRTQTHRSLKELAIYIYATIFDKDKVYPHILLRDYARQTIEYALLIIKIPDINIKKIRPPYKSDAPVNFPTTKQIDTKYRKNYKAKDFKDYYRGQNAILDSMTTEYGRGIAQYGDFGRYTFQSALRKFKVDANKWSNWAIRRIFELGYDVEKHGKFDSQRAYGRGGNHKERIGKKYQWIVFYEVLARVSDNYTMTDRGFGDEIKVTYEGPWDPYVRDIDPSILIKETKEDKKSKDESFWWDKIGYENWMMENTAWVTASNDLVQPEKLIYSLTNDGDEWAMLEGHPEWTEPKKLGEDKWNFPQKRVWYQIRSYFVQNSNKANFIKWAKTKNFWGRWMPEPGNRYEVFNLEYYWSQAYGYFENEYHSGGQEREVFDGRFGKKIGKVMVPTNYYLWEEEFDCSKEFPLKFMKPSKYLYEGMQMAQSVEDGVFVNKKGEKLCFDPSVNQGGYSCLLIRKKPFFEFLKKKKLFVFWTVIGEKQVLGNWRPTGNFKNAEFNGFFTLDNNGKLIGELKFDSYNR